MKRFIRRYFDEMFYYLFWLMEHFSFIPFLLNVCYIEKQVAIRLKKKSIVLRRVLFCTFYKIKSFIKVLNAIFELLRKTENKKTKQTIKYKRSFLSYHANFGD